MRGGTDFGDSHDENVFARSALPIQRTGVSLFDFSSWPWWQSQLQLCSCLSGLELRQTNIAATDKTMINGRISCQFMTAT
jgi:hypothetical protein